MPIKRAALAVGLGAQLHPALAGKRSTAETTTAGHTNEHFTADRVICAVLTFPGKGLDKAFKFLVKQQIIKDGTIFRCCFTALWLRYTLSKSDELVITCCPL